MEPARGGRGTALVAAGVAFLALRVAMPGVVAAALALGIHAVVSWIIDPRVFPHAVRVLDWL